MSETVYSEEPFYNDIEFKVEDSCAALLADQQEFLPPILLSLASEEIDTAHVAIICDDLNSSDPPQNGNWEASVRFKVVSLFDEEIPAGFANLRALHRQRCAVVRDNVMILELPENLSNDELRVEGVTFESVKQRIEGRTWITEFYIKLKSVSGVAD